MKKEKKSKNSGSKVIPTLFIILDGFGLADPKRKGNAITPQTAPNMFSYMKTYPFSKLKAHGKAVGLFPDQEGNSEAGHFNIGAGRVVEQDLVKISETIKDGTFYKNEAFEQAYFHAKKYDTAVHLMGLLTDRQSAHAAPEHVYALLEYFKRKKYEKVFLHLFTDGRDSPPHSAVKYLRELREHMNNGERIASIMGRFYAMDRNKIWSRTKQAYEAIVLGKGGCGYARSAEEAISQAYNRGETDEYICPTVIVDGHKSISTIEDNDVIYFFNARSDRARQITKAFIQDDFNKLNPNCFKRKRVPKNIRFVAMTDFGPDLPGIFTAFPSPDINNCLAKVIDDNYKQLYISETEKYAHVTYFMNGGFPKSINGEDREVVPSPKSRSYAERPGMSARKMAVKIKKYFEAGKYNFVCVNFPNPDMVGHTGNFEAAKKAVSVVDEQVKLLVDTLLKIDGQLMIIADHGNAEEMINLKTGEMLTQHTTNPVPCVIISKKRDKIKLKNGGLSDVAPTLLKMMGIKKPKDMTGHELF